ncbi:cytochrome P450 [Xylaria intraflava]|nr:cytochrome P450 [Xylaria intraflava]
MEAISGLLTLQRLGLTILVYYATLAFYRLFLHPLARFPGPKLAAVSRWYEGYYDVVLDGQYTFKIAELHKKYGPIVRISPHELHVNDAAFCDQIYRQDGIWNKYDWTVDAIDARGAGLFTPEHGVHKARRQPLNPFFSKARVNSRQETITRYLDKLCGRISAFAEAGESKTFNFGASITAFARDVAHDFILGKSYGSLDADDFNVAMTAATSGSGRMWRVGKHLRFFVPMMKAIPISLIMKYGDHATKIFFTFMKEHMEDTERLVAASGSLETAPTIVHEIMKSNLPASDKTVVRVFDDVSVITGAGFETIAGALRTALFHIYDNRRILEKLRAELSTVDTSDLKVIEQLPYLKAVLMEGLRISPALGTRQSRIAPDRVLQYNQWQIPPGTPVGMTLVLLHADESVYPNPRAFNPDRWLGPDGGPKSFAPFSKGTRGCLGLHLAWAEMNLLVAGLVTRFDFRFPTARADDFECISDQFVVGTKGKGVLDATVSVWRR